MKNKVVAAGAGGFIGGFLTKVLLSHGHEVRVLMCWNEMPQNSIFGYAG